MPYRAADFALTTEQVLRVRNVLHTWDARDPWAANAQQLGAQLTGLAYEVCAPRVPLINTPEEAARFLRDVLAADAARRSNE